MERHRITAILFGLLAGLAGPAWAQLGTPSARSLGLADSYMARARGYEAPFWNPANLGLSDRPGWSVGLAGASGYLNNNSLSYGQVTDLYGEFIDDATKSRLLADIRRDDPDRMFELAFDVGANVLGVSVGRLAIGFGAIGAGDIRVTPDAMELLLFGNVGEDGTGKDFSLAGSQAQVWALSGVSLSYAQPFTYPTLIGVTFSVGASIKYGVAHGLARLTDNGSVLTGDPLALNVDAEALTSNDADAGRVWAVDLGAAMEWGPSLVVGLSVANALTNIAWNEDVFELTQFAAQADFDSTAWTDTTFTFAELSPADQERVTAALEAADLPRQLRLGGLYRLGPRFTLSADYVEQIGGSLRARWERTLAVGGELRPTDVLPLRAGLATNFEQVAVTGGLGIYAGPVHLDFSIGRWGVLGGDGIVGALSLSVWPGSGY
jgi:hypothetical protein